MNRKSRNIVITSVLKPVDDVRLFEKFALSISDLENFKIHIIAHKSVLRPQAANIQFHPVFNFTRLSWKRFFTAFIYINALFKIRPNDIIIATHELLWPSLIYKIFTKVNLYYDVQENYAAKLLNANTFSPFARDILATYVRAEERLVAPFIRHFFLAEQRYANELDFIGNKYSIIENKFKGEIKVSHKPVSDKIKFIYTGTIAEIYGTLDAIDFVKQIYQSDDQVSLTIIGFCSQASYFHKIKEAIAGYPYIQLIGGENLVPHQQIIEAVNEADVALLPYLANPSTDKCIPTKLYECIALKVPVIIPENPLWISIMQKYKAGISIDFKHFDTQEVLTAIKTKAFYTKGDFDKVLWKSEAEKLKTVLNYD